MASPAAVLDILLVANTKQANAALAKTQGQLATTSKTATATSATFKKAMLGIGLAAGAAGVALFKVGEEFDDAFDKISTRTGATGREMRKLKGVFRDVVSDVPASFDDAATAVGDLNTRLGLSGKPLKAMSKQMTELARITETDVEGNIESVSKAFVDWEVNTKRQAKTLDGFYRLSQASGMAVADIASEVQRFGSPLRQFGFSIEEAASMFASFERAGVNTQTMLPGLKFALRSFMEAGLEPGKALKETFEGISDGTVKAQKAFEIFGGRATPDMIEAIQQGRFEFDKFIKTFEGADGAIREQGRRTMDLSEHWTKFKNNLKLAVEPVARKVFKGLGDLMKEVTTTFKKEGLSGVLDLLLQKLSDAVPKIADFGTKIAGALVKGFLNAPILGQLAIGAWLMTKFGGAGAFSSLGTKAGQWFGLAFIAAIEVQQIAKMISGEMLDATTRELKASELERAGYTAIQFIGKGMISALGPGGEMFIFRQKNGEWIQRVVDDFKDWKQVPLLAARHGSNAFGEWEKWLGKITDVGRTDGQRFKTTLGQLFGDVSKKANTESTNAWRYWRDFGIKLNGNQGSGQVDRYHDRLRELFGDIPKEADKGSGDAWQYWRDFGIKLNSEQGSGKVADFKGSVAGSFRSLAKTSINAIGKLASETGKTLKSFKVDSQVYVANWGGGSAADTVTAQTGTIVPGTGTGDKVPAMLEPGEVVLNRKAVAAMGGANKANAINAMIPRFAGGGVVFPHRSYPMLSGDTDMNPALGQRLSQMAQAANTAISVTSGGRTYAEQVALQGGPNPAAAPGSSHHEFVNGAIAADISPGYERFGGMASKFGMVFNLLGIGEPWHIELANAANAASGAAAQVVKDIKRVLLEGPDGPLKEMGQAALDKVHAAANNYLGKQTPQGVAPSGGIPADVSGSVAAYAQSAVGKRWGAGQWPPFLTLKTKESGPTWDPTITNPSSGAGGIPQALPPSKMGSPAWPPTQGKTSAIAQINWMLDYIAERYGTPAGALAFHNANNWYKQGGIIQKLAKGGKVKTKPGFWPGIGTGQASSGGHSQGVMPSGYAPNIDLGTPPIRTLPKGISDALFWLSANIANLEEQISVAESLSAFATSELGTAMGPGETAAQIGLNEKLLGSLIDYASYLRAALATPGLDRQSYIDWGTELTNIQGLTGRGGKILTTRSKLDSLNAPETTTIDNRDEIISLLQANLLSTQRALNVSQAQYGVFAGMKGAGGKVGAGQWAIAGESGPEVVTGPAQVYSNSESASMMGTNVRVVIQDQRTRVFVDDQEVRAIVQDETRQMTRGRPLPGVRG